MQQDESDLKRILEILQFSRKDDFKAYFFKYFIQSEVFATRMETKVSVIFVPHNWTHVFLRDGKYFDMQRAQRMPWILEALQRPHEIREGYTLTRDVYLLTGKRLGEDFCVVVEKPNQNGKSHFITAFPLTVSSLQKIRMNPLIWQKE